MAFMIPWFWNVEFGNKIKKMGFTLFRKILVPFFSAGVEGHFKDTKITTVE